MLFNTALGSYIVGTITLLVVRNKQQQQQQQQKQRHCPPH
jgi:hypothetical protein